MLSTTPIQFNGQEIVPIQFLKALLPDPASLGPRTKGKTNIGCIFTGKKDGKEKTYYIYNVCDHQECYKEVGSQAISYTTGVPAMCGALMLLTGKWTKPRASTPWKSLIRTPIWMHWTSTACPAPRATPRLWWTDALHRHPSALCRPARQRAGCPAGCPALPLLPAGRGPAPPQRRNSAGRPAADGLQDSAGTESVLQCSAATPFWPPIWRAPTASGLYESPAWAKRSFRTKKTMCSAPPTGPNEFDELLQYADHIVFNSPRQLAKFGPAAKAAGKSVGLRVNPECSTQEGHAIYDPCAPGSRLGTTRAQWDAAVAQQPGLAALLDGLHFHTLCEQDADALAATLPAVEESVRRPAFPNEMAATSAAGTTSPAPVTTSPRWSAASPRHSANTACRSIWSPARPVALNAGYLLTTVLDTLAERRDVPCHPGHVRRLPHAGRALKCHTARL